MRLELTGQHVDITPALRRFVEARLEKLKRKLNDSAVSAQVVLKREKNRCCVDITLHARGERFLHGTGAATTWEPAVSASFEKLAHQAKRLKGKWEARKRPGRRPPAIDQGEPTARGLPPGDAGPSVVKPRVRARMPRILRAERQAIKLMTLTDAVRQVDQTQGLVVFRDLETSAVSVLYRRNGELTLVETE